ncbi:uncharacterized protein LOC144744524 [Ciona intestinalis]
MANSGKDPCIFKLSYKTIVERAIAVTNDTPQREKTRSELFSRQQKRDESKREFVYALKHLGSRAYAEEEETSMRNEVLYLALVHGLADKELANSIPKKIGYSRDFWDAAELVINSEPSSRVLEVAPIANVSKQVDTTREDLVALRLELENMKRMIASFGTSRVRNTPPRPTTAGRECFGCGQFGHIRRFCPNLQPRARNRMQLTGRSFRADSAEHKVQTKRTGIKHKNADSLSGRVEDDKYPYNVRTEPVKQVCGIDLISSLECPLPEIREAQHNDKCLAPVFSWLERGVRPKHYKVKQFPLESRHYWALFHKLRLKNDVIYHMVGHIWE